MRNHYERLDIWKRSKFLAIDIIKGIEGVRYSYLKHQLGKSALSVASNIAEGADRRSGKEFLQFLIISRGSLAELSTQIEILQEVDTHLKGKCSLWLNKIMELRCMLNALIRKKSTEL